MALINELMKKSNGSTSHIRNWLSYPTWCEDGSPGIDFTKQVTKDDYSNCNLEGFFSFFKLHIFTTVATFVITTV